MLGLPARAPQREPCSYRAAAHRHRSGHRPRPLASKGRRVHVAYPLQTTEDDRAGRKFDAAGSAVLGSLIPPPVPNETQDLLSITERPIYLLNVRLALVFRGEQDQSLSISLLECIHREVSLGLSKVDGPVVILDAAAFSLFKQARAVDVVAVFYPSSISKWSFFQRIFSIAVLLRCLLQRRNYRRSPGRKFCVPSSLEPGELSSIDVLKNPRDDRAHDTVNSSTG